MPLWKRSASDDQQKEVQARQDAEASLLSLEVGGLPVQAKRRLQEETAAGHPLFTSDLSADEFLLTRQPGYSPLGQVMGSTIYHRGANSLTLKNGVDTLSQAHQQAATLALGRLRQEAALLHAHGVIGVRFTRKHFAWEQEILEYVAIGTAIRSRNGQSYRNAKGMPFTSDLSGQDFWTLLRTGYRPVGLVMGNCVYHVAHQSFGQWLKQAGRNTEVTTFTQALYDARELAMEREQAEALALNAQGIVGSQIHESSHSWEGHIIEFFAIGTAVVSISDTHTVPAPALTLLLND